MHALVYMLGHAGRLKEAEMLIRNMGLQLDSSAWESLLDTCRIHGEVELGKRSTVKVVELEALCFIVDYICNGVSY